MKILLAAATAVELGGLECSNPQIGQIYPSCIDGNHTIDQLITGIGVASTTFYLAQIAPKYDLVLSIGIAGSFTNQLSIGDVVCVSHDIFADYGIDDNGKFIPFNKIGPDTSLLFMQNQWINHPKFAPQLPVTKGITVCMASGSEGIIERRKELWSPEIETMENAAIFFVCNEFNIPFVCLRAISNMVEPRNSSNWKIPLAIERLLVETTKYIKGLR